MGACGLIRGRDAPGLPPQSIVSPVTKGGGYPVEWRPIRQTAILARLFPANPCWKLCLFCFFCVFLDGEGEEGEKGEREDEPKLFYLTS